jgi:hypothetical protein
VSYTNALKVKQIGLYGYADHSTSSYEEDHLIPISVGGSPTDPGNLWPEPAPAPNKKDKLEFWAYKGVCNGTVSLAEAQTDLSLNWLDAYNRIKPGPTPFGGTKGG